MHSKHVMLDFVPGYMTKSMPLVTKKIKKYQVSGPFVGNKNSHARLDIANEG